MVPRVVPPLRERQPIRARARPIAAVAPGVAILPFQDERLARQLLAFSASGCYSLDTPIERLKSGFFAQKETT